MSGRRIASAPPALLALVLGLGGCGGGHVPLPRLDASASGDKPTLVKRGEYIVRNVAVCGHCHAADPKDSDGPLSGGFAFRDWRVGTIRAANLTPDSTTGLGMWSEAEIVRAVRNGADRDGHLLAPIMPYEWFHDMSDQDALAVALYLKSLPAVRNEVRSQRNVVFALAKLFFLGPKKSPTPAAPARGATAEYGAYLSNHVALCADCHTPRGGLQAASKMNKLFAGTAKPPKGFPANPANLTPDRETGIGAWSEQDFIQTIRSGTDPKGHKLHSFMPYRQFRRMSDDDLRAIHRYLRTLPPIRNVVPHDHEAEAGEGGEHKH